jgi:hypothetical protein
VGGASDSLPFVRAQAQLTPDRLDGQSAAMIAVEKRIVSVPGQVGERRSVA